MSAQNPKLALDGILETDSNKSQVKPLTIARYALLELIGSPLVFGTKEHLTLTGIIPTLYVMCAETDELRGWNSSNVEQLKEKAFNWADNQEDVSVID